MTRGYEPGRAITPRISLPRRTNPPPPLRSLHLRESSARVPIPTSVSDHKLETWCMLPYTLFSCNPSAIASRSGLLLFLFLSLSLSLLLSSVQLYSLSLLCSRARRAMKFVVFALISRQKRTPEVSTRNSVVSRMRSQSFRWLLVLQPSDCFLDPLFVYSGWTRDFRSRRESRDNF